MVIIPQNKGIIQTQPLRPEAESDGIVSLVIPAIQQPAEPEIENIIKL
jgi:hypothetical protein